MDLLKGYESDLSDDETDHVPGSGSGDAVAQGPQSTLQASRQAQQPPNVAAVTENEGSQGVGTSKGGSTSGIWAHLPPPTSSASASVPSTSGLSGLPPPKASDTRGGARKVVTMQLPFRKELLAAALDSDDEDEPAAKRVKATGAKSRLMDFLPPPKHDRGPVRALGDGGGGGGSGAGARQAKAAAAQSSGADAPAGATNGAVPGSTKLPADFFTGEADVYDNEAYRIRDDNDAGSGPPGAAPGAYYDASGGPYAVGPYGAAPDPAAYYGHGYGAGAAAAGPSGGRGAAGGGAAAEPEDLIAQALRAEQERASKRGGGAGGLKLVEINAQDLTRMDPATREAANSARDALGPEYALSLRRSAAPFEGSKMARRKHQIGTLLFNARMQELDQLEKKTQGQKSKAETAAKYGW